jgi:hypothetical protein
MHDETPPPSSSLKEKRCLDAPNRVLVTNLVVRLMSHIFCYDHMSHEAADEAVTGWGWACSQNSNEHGCGFKNGERKPISGMQFKVIEKYYDTIVT